VKQQVLEEVLASMTQASEQPSAARAQARSASINGHDALLDALGIKELRARTKLSQADFAALLGVELSTLRNWEQGRRVPAGPARALLRAIRNDPQNVIRALARAA
jgi:putative transcriptional regulator